MPAVENASPERTGSVAVDTVLQQRAERAHAGRWHVTLQTKDGEVTITAPNAISTEAMREAMRAYWGATHQTSIGVGDGSGNLYVQGEYEACKRVQDLIEENRVLRARVRDLGEKT
jgi:hypothetical protein